MPNQRSYPLCFSSVFQRDNSQESETACWIEDMTGELKSARHQW